MTEGTRPVGEVRDTIIKAISATHAPDWEPTRPTGGVAEQPSAKLLAVILARLTGRAKVRRRA